MSLYRIALGGEDALSNSKTAVNLELSEHEVAVLKSVDERMWRATHGQETNGYHPRIRLQELPK